MHEPERSRNERGREQRPGRGEQRDPRDARAQRGEIEVPRRLEDQRRQEHEQQRVAERERRRNRDHGADGDERDGRRDADALGEDRDERRDAEQRDERAGAVLDRAHATSCGSTSDARAQRRVGVRRERRLFRVHLDDVRAGEPLRRERRGRLHESRRSDDEHHVGAPRGVERALERAGRERLPEPHDVRAPAATARVLGRRDAVALDAREHVVERHAFAAPRARRVSQCAVQLEHVLRAGEAVERVDVLRREREVAHAPLELGERRVRRRRTHRRMRLAAFRVPRPHESRIAREAFGGRELFDAVRTPEPAHAAERRQPAFGGDAGTGEHHHGARRTEPLPQISEVAHRIGHVERRFDGGGIRPPARDVHTAR